MRETFPDLDRAQYGLRPVRTEILLGFVFVCLAGDPPPLRSVWGEFLEDFSAPSLRGHGAARAAVSRRVAGGLEDGDGQLPRVLPRADRTSGPVRACSLPTTTTAHPWHRRGARHQSACARGPRASGASGCIRQFVGRRGHGSARIAAPALELLQHAAESRHRRVSRPDGFLPGAAARPRALHHPRRHIRVCPIHAARCAWCATSTRASTGRCSARTIFSAGACSAASRRAVMSRDRSRGSRAACGSFTNCCANGSRRRGWRARRLTSLKQPARRPVKSASRAAGPQIEPPKIKSPQIKSQQIKSQQIKSQQIKTRQIES